MKKKFDAGLVWFRRDLRAHDHAALYHALRSCRQVWCVFVFDQEILDALPRSDRRVDFIHASVQELDGLLRDLAPVSYTHLDVYKRQSTARRTWAGRPKSYSSLRMARSVRPV